MTEVSQEAREAAFTDDDAFREMHLLYNYADDDSRQFTRWQMSVAMYHGIKLGEARQSAERGEVVAWHDVIAERRRQIEKEGWSFEHDDAHEWGQMAGAAVCYALTNVGHWAAGPAIDQFWPWDKAWWKPTDKRRNLVKAAALLLAEIERIDRTTLPTPPEAVRTPIEGTSHAD